MRINDLLSKPISDEFAQCDPFLGDNNLGVGKQRKLNAGQVFLNYHCNLCDRDITFQSVGDLFGIRVDDRLLSIDCVLQCPSCRLKMPIWFLVESMNNLNSCVYNKYRILKLTEKFDKNISIVSKDYGGFSYLLKQAEISHINQLGSAAIVYLRKVFEGVTHQVGTATGINLHKTNGKLRPFKDILQEVDKQNHIIPEEFRANGYQLFCELSDIVHGSSDNNEDLGLKKYKALKRLITGILDNVKNKDEIMTAIGTLGWQQEGEIDE